MLNRYFSSQLELAPQLLRLNDIKDFHSEHASSENDDSLMEDDSS